MEFANNIYFLSFFVFIAGFVDSMAGGGGTITIPGYLAYGINSDFLLGTNKLSSTMGTFVATTKYLSELKFKKKYLFIILISATLFSFAGALLISYVANYLIKIIVFVTMPVISIYLLFKKDFGIIDQSNLLTEKQINTRSFFITGIVSFYDGMLGPATGTFLCVLYSKFIGYDILKSTAISKFSNLISNISALITFLILNRVNIKLGLSMAVLSIIGNYIGSHIALKKGIIIIKPLMFIISNLIIIKLILDFIK